MASRVRFHPDRRQLLLGGASVIGMLAVAGPVRADLPVREYSLAAYPARTRLAGINPPEIDVWTYGGTLPGPEIRVKKGERLRVRFENRLREETTVHWHGIRLPNAMDGVPHLTQKPVAPGETFVYEFKCPDAGTYWYHPHQRSHEQVGRGLSGALIVEEPTPYPVDREQTWVIGDWRLGRDGDFIDDFGDLHDISHNGRIGNTITINGKVPGKFAVRAGERIRLRLINAASARILALHFDGHQPKVVALDGQPVAPHDPEGGSIILGPAMRADIVLDMTNEPGSVFTILDRPGRNRSYRLFDMVYDSSAPVRKTFGAVPALPSNPLAEPDLENAVRHVVTLNGGMMSRMESAIVDGKRVDAHTMFRSGLMWAINGVAAKDHVHEPMLNLALGKTYLFELVNESAWLHPMHLHGHAFRFLSANGRPRPHREWLDTVLLWPRERVEIAFVADNPGDWMFHCHNLEHQLGGMMALVRVS